MSSIKVNCGKIEISNNNKICIIAGPCQLETEQHAMDMAGKIHEITKKFNLGFIYKTSFDKANRTSLKGKRGAGLDASLPVFDKIKKELGIPILTDIHNIEQCTIVSEHVDVLQIPAFLCRQTDLLIAAAKTNKIINVKKGQLLAPWDMVNVTKKISDSRTKNILVTERGESFGYNTEDPFYRAADVGLETCSGGVRYLTCWGETRKLVCDEITADVRVDINGTGEIEYNDGTPNATIDSISAYQSLIDAHTAAAPPVQTEAEWLADQTYDVARIAK